VDYQYYLKREQGRGNREQARGKREEGRGKREEGRGKRQRTTDNGQLTTNNSIQKYVFIACKVVKYQIVTFYENRLRGEQYAKNTRRHLP
jgi:hypothetical protein